MAQPSRADSLRWAPATPARRSFESGLDELGGRLDSLTASLDQPSSTARQAAFRSARTAYKRIETLLEVYSPATAALLNGPLPEESEDRPAGALGAPAGFQVLEAALFPGGDSTGLDSLRRTAAAMRDAVRQFRELTKYLAVADAALLDATRLELTRVATLGLAGFDSDPSGDAVIESAAALEGTAATLRSAHAGPASTMAEAHRWSAADSALTSAAAYLRAHPDFQRLDRLTFIVAYLSPAARAVQTARAALPEPLPGLRRLWRATAATPFEAGAFDPAAFAPTFAPAATPRLIALGRRLFFEPRLSGPGTRSCGFCHMPARGFTDGRVFSAPLAGATVHRQRNTPTLLNAGLQPTLFADSRVGSLESQVETVLASPTEMGGSAEITASRLATDTSYQREFAEAFAGRPDTTVNARALRLALAAYVRSLTALDSRFDRALRGDSTVLTPIERRGFTLFMGKGRCGTCHFLPLFNGTMPPGFAISEPEIIGVPARPADRPARLDSDPGRGGFDHEGTHQGAFKVPTLRNVSLTGPYMHNGAFRTLAEVIQFYDHGGGAGEGASVPGQTLPARPLHLTTTERSAVAAFLGSLTDTVIGSASANAVATH